MKNNLFFFLKKPITFPNFFYNWETKKMKKKKKKKKKKNSNEFDPKY